MSAFTNMYALQDDSCNHPPQFNGHSPQSWSPPSTVSYAATVSISDISPSQISQEAFENRMPVSRGMSTNLSLKYHPSSNSQKHTIVEPITQSTSPTSPPANTTVNPHPKLHQLHPSQAYVLIKSKPSSTRQQQLYYPQ